MRNFRVGFPPTLLACLLLGSAPAPALADGIESGPAIAARAPDFVAGDLFLDRHESGPYGPLQLFTESVSVSTALRARILDLQGGASMHLLPNVRLTGTLRLVDYEFDDVARRTGVVWEQALPMLGLSLDF